MTNIFEGNPDARLSHDPAEKPTRFRPRYRQLSEAEKALHDQIKTAAAALETLIEQVPQGRETSIAMTKLEESIMWAVKGLTK